MALPDGATRSGSRWSTSAPTPRASWWPTWPAAPPSRSSAAREVTRLGEGVDSSGRLADDAMERVFSTVVGDYRELMDGLGERGPDDRRGHQRGARLRERRRVPRRRCATATASRCETIAGEEEARLTFLGATARREPGESALVIDIGGGSTEYVVGAAGEEPSFRVSTRLGSVRQTERHLRRRPAVGARSSRRCGPRRARSSSREVPEDVRREVAVGIAVAGTATQLAAVDLELDPYDPDRVDGHRLSRARVRGAAGPPGGGAARGAASRSRASIPTARRPSWPARRSCSNR